MRTIIYAAALAFGVIAGPAFAEEVAFKATLSPQAEVPPHADLKGSGTVEATFDPATKVLHYKVTYAGLTGAAAAAHFHGPAAAGQNAGVMVPVSGELASPIDGSATLTDEQAKALQGGQLYFNIHTAANKNGEVRGQVEKTM